MATISLYVSGQTELNDVTEFFQKRLLAEGETPIAFFDGVFYESHQERVGNIVFQDYLVYSDKAVYLWARGTSKDFLDRFPLGTVSVNSRNKDSAFATMNLKIRREAKEPIYVIFDMVEIREAETIARLHAVIESTVEDRLGMNYRQELPPDVSREIVQLSSRICPPRPLSIALEAPSTPVPDAAIGYGQDLLEQYKASLGYGQQQPQQMPGNPGMRSGGPATGAANPARGLESMLPADPASIKRLAGQIKDMVGDAPFKLRDQVMKDLQHVPGDLATVLTALNELLANIAGNPMAERFVMNAIKTAVVNDGMLGSLGKIIKLATGPGGTRKAPAQQEAPARKQERAPAPREEEADDTQIRRKRISIKDDSSDAGAFDPFAETPFDDPDAAASRTRPAMGDDEADPGFRRKKISVKMAPEDAENDIARKLMSYDESQRAAGDPAPPYVEPANNIEPELATPRKKKLVIKADEGSGADADIARKLMGYDEAAREAASLPVEPVDHGLAGEEIPVPRRKKIQVKPADEDDGVVISEEFVMAAIAEIEKPAPSAGYMTIESDLPVAAKKESGEDTGSMPRSGMDDAPAPSASRE